MRQHPFFRACHTMLANKNQRTVRSIEFRRGPHRLALQQFYSRVNIHHGKTATAVVTVQDDHLRRTPFIQSLDRRIDFARQQLARLLPSRALPRNALKFDIKDAVYTFSCL